MQRFADSPFGSHLIFGGTWAKCWHHNASLQWIMQTCQSRSWNHCMNMHELTNRETCGNCILLEVNSSNANWQGHRNLYRWWTVMSSVYQTCETSSHRPEFLSPAHLSSPVPTRHHSSLKKSFAWPEISSMIFLGIFWKSDGRWRLCFTFDKHVPFNQKNLSHSPKTAPSNRNGMWYWVWSFDLANSFWITLPSYRLD